MDREIPKEVRDKERKKKFIKYGAIGVAAVGGGAVWRGCGGSGMYSCIDFVYAKQRQ